MKEYRRIQKTGESTYIISLPKKWANLNNIQSGTEATIKENEDGSLTISVKKEQKEAIAIINTNNDLSRTLQKIMAAYLAGYSKITIKGSNAASACEEARFKLSGLEIIDEKTGEGILSVLSKGDEFNISDILNRMHSITNALLAIVADGIKGQKGLEKEATRRETEVDRLYILALRSINIQSSRVSLAVCNALVAKTLERISDHTEFLYSESLKVVKNEDAISIIASLRELYSQIFDDFTNRNNKEQTITKLTNYQKDISKQIQKANQSLKPFLERCLRISEYLFDIIEITEDISAIQSSTV